MGWDFNIFVENVHLTGCLFCLHGHMCKCLLHHLYLHFTLLFEFWQMFWWVQIKCSILVKQLFKLRNYSWWDFNVHMGSFQITSQSMSSKILKKEKIILYKFVPTYTEKKLDIYKWFFKLSWSTLLNICKSIKHCYILSVLCFVSYSCTKSMKYKCKKLYISI